MWSNNLRYRNELCFLWVYLLGEKSLSCPKCNTLATNCEIWPNYLQPSGAMWCEDCWDSLKKSTTNSIVLLSVWVSIIVSEFEKFKGVTLRIFRILVLKRLYLWNRNSYELQTWHEYSFIILLHLLQFASPAHFRYGRGEHARQSRSKNAVLCPSLAAHCSGQEACSDF